MRKVIKGSWVIAAAVAGVVATSAVGQTAGIRTFADEGSTTKRPGVALADEGSTTKRPGVALADEGSTTKRPGVVLADEGSTTKRPGINA